VSPAASAITKWNYLADYHWYPGERWDQQYAHAVPETSYASCGDLSLAYQVFGDGPIELVFVGPFVTHIELFWTIPEFKAFFDQLARFCRIVVFDKAGVGLSDPVPHVRTVDDRATEIEAVMDAVGFGRAVLFGMNDGDPTFTSCRDNPCWVCGAAKPDGDAFSGRRPPELRTARPGARLQRRQ
jgi:hypothetical protein